MMQSSPIGAGGDARPLSSGTSLSVALWIAQVLLALLFVFAGVMKFVMPVAEMTKQTPLPGWFIHFIGVVEVLGGIGLIAPGLFRMWRWLTPVAACGLVIIMAGATVLSAPRGWAALFPALIGLVAAFIAYGRFRLP